LDEYLTMTAQYLLLRPHLLGSVEAAPGAVITEGVDVPGGWVPTLAVDPLNAAGATAFYNAGPRDGGAYEDLIYWPGWLQVAPVTRWVKTGGPIGYWSLTGLGAGFAPIPIGGGFPTGTLLDEGGGPLLDEQGYAITE
jgi:hypothetical protein